MYSPFRDEQGRPKALADITYSDLDQLAELDEGYVLEFKRSWNQPVKRKVPKIIASFANSAGGWLVIGIADDTKEICPVPRGPADYSQVIGEICRRHISPAPRFDVRFIVDPANHDQGVVVVQVPEGDFPPYVADGVVEIREGSTSGPAAGSALVDLYGKATRRRGAVLEFCHRTVWYPSDDAAASGGSGAGAAAVKAQPLYSLYLYRMGQSDDPVPSREDIEEHVQAMRRAFARQSMGCRVQHAHDSLIIRSATASGAAGSRSAIELFPDESMKLTVPAVMVSAEERPAALQALREAGADVGESTQLISAQHTLARVTRMASLLDRYVRERDIPWTSYAVAYELEGMAGAVLWSPDPVYLRYVRGHGVLYCGTTDCRSRVRYLDDGAHDLFRARQFAGSHFFEACGLPLGSPDPEDSELVDALLRGGKPYRPGDQEQA